MITFRYRKEPSGGKVIYRPVADVKLLSVSGMWIDFHPYIDSGADVTLVPLTLGKLLGFQVSDQQVSQIGGIRGSIPVIYERKRMKVGECEFEVLLGWALVEDVPPLLGRTDVFEKFEITFKQSEGVVNFELV